MVDMLRGAGEMERNDSSGKETQAEEWFKENRCDEKRGKWCCQQIGIEEISQKETRGRAVAQGKRLKVAQACIISAMQRKMEW